MRPFWIWRSHAHATHQFHSQRVTPIVQSIGLRWPGGGWLWQYPLAVEVDDRTEATHQRIPIPDPTRTIVWFLGALTLAILLLAGLTRWRSQRRKRHATKPMFKKG